MRFWAVSFVGVAGFMHHGAVVHSFSVAPWRNLPHPQSYRHGIAARTSYLASSANPSISIPDTAPCAEPQNSKDLRTNSALTAATLRSAILTNVDGNLVRLGDQIGEGTAVVVFLRHLGCPFCWSYAKQWCELQPALAESGITGPWFVSIGDAEKLNKFLQVNPFIPSNQVFVDGYNFTAYKNLGFQNFNEQDPEIVKGVKMPAPELGGVGQWWNYLSNMMALSPVEKNQMKLGTIPEGVLRLGGTFVVKGDEIVYRWNDRLPGDHPDLQQVLAIAKDAKL